MGDSVQYVCAYMLRTRELGAAEGVPVGCADGAEGLLVGCSEGDDGLPVGCPDGSPVGDSTCCFPFVLRLVLGFLLPLALVLGSALTKLWLLCITIAKTKSTATSSNCAGSFYYLTLASINYQLNVDMFVLRWSFNCRK